MTDLYATRQAVAVKALTTARAERDRLAAELAEADAQVDLYAMVLRGTGATLAEVARVGGWSGPAGAAKAIARAHAQDRARLERELGIEDPSEGRRRDRSVGR